MWTIYNNLYKKIRKRYNKYGFNEYIKDSKEVYPNGISIVQTIKHEKINDIGSGDFLDFLIYII